MSARELITDHLDLWTGAVTTRSTAGRGTSSGKRGKIELTGIKKLRRLILELAVRGKLVPQPPEEAAFSELLLKLRQDHTPPKTRGRKRVSGEVSPDEQPFNIPGNWAWTRLGEIAEVLDSQRKPITKSARKDGPYPYYGASGIVDYVDGYLFDEPLVLVGEDGAKWDKGEGTAFPISGKTWVNNHAHVLRPRREAITDEYLVYFLTAADLNPYITGMTVPKLNQARLSSIPVATPSLEEQHRIVEKVDELMALCDRLEQQVGDQLEAHEVLVDTLLDALTRSSDAADLAENWARVAEHFDTLFTTEPSIDKLKQSILQLAVMGRLVEQDPNDEPASELLDKIAEEKARLVKEGKIKQPKVLPEVSVSEQPFELPERWAWARVGDVLSIKHGFAFKSQYFCEEEKPYVLTTPGNFYEEGGFRDRGERTKYYDGQVDSNFILSEGDLIIPMTEQAPGLLGSAAFVPRDGKKYLHNQRLGKLIVHSDLIDKMFVFWFFNSPFLRSEIARTCTGTTVRHTSPKKVREVPFPVITTKEQRRIVGKVDELMALCNQLKARLGEAGETRTHLAEAVVEQAVS